MCRRGERGDELEDEGENRIPCVNNIPSEQCFVHVSGGQVGTIGVLVGTIRWSGWQGGQPP